MKKKTDVYFYFVINYMLLLSTSWSQGKKLILYMYNLIFQVNSITIKRYTTKLYKIKLSPIK